MRLACTYHGVPTERSSSNRSSGRAAHPTLERSLQAHGGGRPMPGRFNPSDAFAGEMERAGVDPEEVRQVLAKGKRTRQWDGCLLVRDRFLGVELELDPSGTFAMRARRVR